MFLFMQRVQVGHDWSLLGIIIAAIIIAAAIGIMFVAFRQFGVTVPAWAITIFWIVVVAVVAIFAIRFLWTL